MINYIIINGTNSNTINGLGINELPPISKPPLRVQTEEIDGRDGDISTNLGYGAYDKTISIGLFGTGYDINEVISFFNGEGTVVFSNEPNKYYKYKIINQIDYEALLKFKSATITFHCQPFKYPLEETPLEIEYEYIEQEGVESATMNNTNGGTSLKIDLKGNTSQKVTNNLINLTSVTPSGTTYNIKAPTITNGVVNVQGKNEEGYAGESYKNGFVEIFGVKEWKANTRYYCSFKADIISNPRGVNQFLCMIAGIYDGYANYNSTTGRFEVNMMVTSSPPTQANKMYLEIRVASCELNISEISIKTTEDYTFDGYGVSPTPDIPSPINVVSGDNEVVVCGKNLFDKNGTLATGYIVESDGHIGSVDNWRVSDYIPIQPNTAYTTSGLNNGAGNNPSRAYYDSNKTFISAKKHSDASPFIDTSPNNAYYMRESIRVLDLDTAQIEIGNTATTYQPYQSQTYPIYLGVENLFDGTMVAGRINTDGSIVGTSSEQNKHSNLIPIQANTPYTYYCSTEIPSGSAYCCNWYDSSQTRISTYNLSGKKVDTQISPINASYISISIYNVEGQQVQFTKGNKPSHISNTQLELCKIGDYQDYFTKNSSGQWCKYNAIGKVVLDGSESWSRGSNGAYYLSVASLGYSKASGITCMSNYFLGSSNTTSSSNVPDNKIAFYNGANAGINELFCGYRDKATASDFETWLSTHNTIVYYVLNTPYLSLIEDSTLIEQLDNIQNAMSYDGTTNISQVNNDKPFLLDLIAMEKGTDEVVINNIGNVYAKPTIALEGTGETDIYLNNTEILKVDLSEKNKITIDTNNMEAYDPTDNSLANRKVIGNYNSMTLPSGNTTMKITGALTKATITDYTRWL